MAFSANTRGSFRFKPEAVIAYRRLAPVLLLLAAMASPVVGTPRPLESLRLVVSIAWLSEDEPSGTQPSGEIVALERNPLAAATPARASRPVDSRALSTALPRARFQRPPPARTSLHG